MAEIVKTVLIVVAVLMVLYLVLNLFFEKLTTLSNKADGKTKQVIQASTLPNNNNTSNYTYSTWFYVDDWNYRFGEPKVLLGLMDQDQHPSPSIVLGARENDSTISVSCFPQ